MAPSAASRNARRLGCVLVAVSSAVVGLAAAQPAGAARAAAGATVPVPVPSCAAAAPGFAQCFALQLVRQPAARVSPAARAAAERAATARPAVLPSGPAGGYTPADLATAYGLNVNAPAAAAVTVAIVDAYDDPTIKADLAGFDAHYGIPAETATSFRVVNQTGATSPLPTADSGWADEITLDVETVRGLCHRCKIVLIEADSQSFVDLAAAEDIAVSSGIHADIISNSYGGSESGGSSSAGSYNHPGVAVIASTGDDGWYSWDYVNTGSGALSADEPNQPASLNTVVAVGGTSLYLNPDGTRASETVWNNNGPYDNYGSALGKRLGASGGGCSTVNAPKKWQSAVTGYASLGCGDKRSAGDIAALADPYTGYDLYSPTLFTGSHWATFGGTSLAAPAIAAMWALAGGPAGVPYPALTLYGHFKSARATYDVTVGGNGACGTASTTSCAGFFGASPNTIGRGQLDCAFAPDPAKDTVAARGQCYAEPGYDGPTGVGTPIGTATFTPLHPTAVIANPGTVSHGHAARFDGAHSTDPFPGGTITTYRWTFGDGATATGAKPAHTYAKKGRTYRVTLTVTDSYGRTGTSGRTVTTK